MQNLKGKNILIGKEPENGRLLVAIEGTPDSTAIGPANSVPGTVSRCIPQLGMAHARISVDAGGNMILSNLKDRNVTFVDGTRVISRHISPDSCIELGPDHFSISMAAILTTARRLVTPPKPVMPQQQVQNVPQGMFNAAMQAGKTAQQQPTFSLKPLEAVWMRYEQQMEEIQAKQKRTNTMRALQGVLSMSGIALGGIMALCGIMAVGIIFSSAALVLGLVGFFITKNDTAAEDRKAALEQLEDSYLCPNPACRKSLPTKPYKWLQRNYTTCSYCKAKFMS